jgi:hypothetical protein
MYSSAERVFTLEHFFASKLFVAFREAISNAYRDKQVPKKYDSTPTGDISGHGKVCLRQVLIERLNS